MPFQLLLLIDGSYRRLIDVSFFSTICIVLLEWRNRVGLESICTCVVGGGWGGKCERSEPPGRRGHGAERRGIRRTLAAGKLGEVEKGSAGAQRNS